MPQPLSTYLHDHLAGARGAIELLETLSEDHEGEAVGRLALELRDEIEEDRRTLRDLAERLGPSQNVLKEAASRVAEKAAQFKLRRKAEDTIGTFESIEFLALGVLGKLKLWQVLASIARDEPALQGPDYDVLIRRAESQHQRLEEARLQLAPRALLAEVS